MSIAFEKLHGLDRDRLVALVEPVLTAHGVEGVELVWRTDRGDWVLELTVERPDSQTPGAGITLEVCSAISRDLSAALDEQDVIPASYRLDVGSPGLERALYTASDYRRFAGQSAKLKLTREAEGPRVIEGMLQGLDDDGRVVIDADSGAVSVELDAIQSGRLEFDWNKGRAKAGNGPQRAMRRPRGARRRTQRSN